jgi:RNA polymerase sigma-70 factor (sigma-E family)
MSWPSAPRTRRARGAWPPTRTRHARGTHAARATSTFGVRNPGRTGPKSGWNSAARALERLKRLLRVPDHVDHFGWHVHAVNVEHDTRTDGQPIRRIGVYEDVEPLTNAPPDADAREQVTALFEAHALGLVKLAKVMVGDQSIAEDVVQDAFVGIYRRWPSLRDRDKALGYLRTSVLNGCRTAYRSRSRRDRALLLVPGADADGIVSAEESALVGESNREVLAALRALPARQREAVVLRHYLGLTEEQAAQAMNISRGTVKSATSRGLSTLARILKENAE